MEYKPPKILVDSLLSSAWEQASPNDLRRCLGDDLCDLRLFDTLDRMAAVSVSLDHYYVDLPYFCITREQNIATEDPRLEFARALFIGGSIVPGDDVFVAIRREVYDDYDPPVLVLDWRKEAPYRWNERGKLSELLKRLGLKA